MKKNNDDKYKCPSLCLWKKLLWYKLFCKYYSTSISLYYGIQYVNVVRYKNAITLILNTEKNMEKIMKHLIKDVI